MPAWAIGRRRALTLSGALLLGLLRIGPLAAAPDPTDASAFISLTGEKVLAVLRDNSLSDEAKLERLIEILDGPIDLELVGRLVLGRHWRTASPEQQATYQRLFRAYALETLASQLNLYSGQTFEIEGAQVANDRDTLVRMLIRSDDRPPLQVEWRLRNRDDGELVVIDMVVEGVSLIITQRDQFGSIIQREGMDGLLAELEKRAGDRA
jgi:phospholipid transport system substrate-binding protein